MGFTIPAIATQHATPLSGAFCVSGGEGAVDEPTRVRQIRPERSWTTAGRPRSARREGVTPRDGVHNPHHRHVTGRSIEGAFCVSGGEGVVDEPTGSTNSSGTNLDDRRSAP